MTLPDAACDSHCHILDPRFPATGPVPPGTALADYLKYRQQIGTGRAVFVQAKLHGTNHDCLADALRKMDGSARGVAVVHPAVPDDELARLDALGVRGLRFSLWNPKDTVTTLEMIAPLAGRIAPLGWHVQLHMSAEQIVQHRPLLDRLPCQMVFDHMGRIPAAEGASHPAFNILCGWLRDDRAWVKLSGPYLNISEGALGNADLQRLARAFVACTPQRLVWGSDWPNLTEIHKPSAAELLRLLDSWVPDAATRSAILTRNPSLLYQF